MAFNLKRSFSIVFAIIVFFYSALSFAQSSSAPAVSAPTATIATPIPSETRTGKFSFSTMFETSSSVANFYSEEGDASTAIRLTPSYKFSDDLSLTAKFRFAQEVYPAEVTKMDVTKVEVGFKTYKLNTAIKLRPVANTFLPTSEAARDDQTLRLGLGGQLNITGEWPVKLGTLDAAYIPAVRGNSFMFESDRGGESNIVASLRHTADVGLTRGKFRIGATVDWISAMNFNNKIKETYDLSQSLSVELAKNVSAELSHSFGGDTLGAEGRETSIGLFGPRYSSVGFALLITN